MRMRRAVERQKPGPAADGITTREMWGSYGETAVAVSLRQRDIASEVKNLKRA